MTEWYIPNVCVLNAVIHTQCRPSLNTEHVLCVEPHVVLGALFYAQMRCNYACRSVPCISSLQGPNLSLMRHGHAKSNQLSLWGEKGGPSSTAGPAAMMTDSQHLTNHWSEPDTSAGEEMAMVVNWWPFLWCVYLSDNPLWKKIKKCSERNYFLQCVCLQKLHCQSTRFTWTPHSVSCITSGHCVAMSFHTYNIHPLAVTAGD